VLDWGSFLFMVKYNMNIEKYRIKVRSLMNYQKWTLMKSSSQSNNRILLSTLEVSLWASLLSKEPLSWNKHWFIFVYFEILYTWDHILCLSFCLANWVIIVICDI
jgi:hypothetical protein